MRKDLLARRAYAQDASVYQEMPQGVLFPDTTEAIIAAVKEAVREGRHIIPRAAGTSLAGQCVGDGMVMDTGRHMRKILEINVEERWVEVQPGVVRDELNHHLRHLGLFFGPNTSTSNRCMIGGMVGNNSSGSTSISYGTTREKLLGLELVDATGTLRKIGEINSAGSRSLPDGVAQWEALWVKAFHENDLGQHFPYPEIHRRNTGYAIDLLAEAQDNADRWLQVLAGSEGTLGLTTKIRLRLDPLPPAEVGVIAFHYQHLHEAMAATPLLMEYRPYQLELMDRTVLECTEQSKEYASYRTFVQGDPEALLLMELRAENREALDKALVAVTSETSYAKAILYGADTDRVWKLRAAGLGLLSNVPGDSKPVACIEDTAVRVQDLDAYIADFGELMASFGQSAVYYAHAGAGELHLRPILNLKTSEGAKLMHAISEASAALVKKYRGSLSGEHGDGRVRASFIQAFYGDEVYGWMVSLKAAWDPNGILNPGKIVGAKDMLENLRYAQDAPEPKVESYLNFSEDGGFLRAVEKCNGSGDCRRLPFSDALMCPSYMASKEEWDSTRGRANVLRSVLTEQHQAGFTAQEVSDALEHCVGCKGCTKECPSGVDMAAMKLEYLYQNRGKRTVANFFIAHVHLTKHLRWMNGVLNWTQRRAVFKKALGLAPHTELPELQSGALLNHYLKSHPTQSRSQAPAVVLWADEFTGLYEAQRLGKSIDLFEALGYQVGLIYAPSGRALLSGGYLPQAKGAAERAVRKLFEAQKAMGAVAIVGLEPSAVLSAKDEYLRLLDGDLLKRAQSLQPLLMTLDRFLAQQAQKGHLDAGRGVFSPMNETVLVHQHCHQKALEGRGETAYVLQALLGAKAAQVKSSCCGMAGAYGMQAKNAEMSYKMANLALLPAIENFNAQWILATGTSCRHQIQALGNREAAHLVDVLWNQLKR